MNTKKLIALVGAACLAIGLAACGNGTTQADGQSDTIFLGYPIWWGDLSMPVYTFLDSHRFDGKKVIPFSTHGGSGLAGTVAKVAQAEPGADVENNAYTVSRDDVVQAKDSVLSWLAQLGY